MQKNIETMKIKVVKILEILKCICYNVHIIVYIYKVRLVSRGIFCAIDI